jgi:hypothetical protein
MFGVDKSNPCAVLDWHRRQRGTSPPPTGWNGRRRLPCRDGHEVQSNYERSVDDWLFKQGIRHTYEPAIPLAPGYHADFFANNHYIEIWGARGVSRSSARCRV